MPAFNDGQNPNSRLLRVRLREFGEVTPLNIQRTFAAQATPMVSESQAVNYKQFDPVHAPGSILSYVNTPSRTFTMTDVKLISRTPQEADNTIRRINLLRSWTKPVFGRYTVPKTGPDNKVTYQSQTTLDSADPNAAYYLSNTDVLGAPPKVLEFTAYSSNDRSRYGNINGIPVVITNLNISYPNDVDYIPSSSGTPVPIMMSVDISLTETHAPIEYANFSIADYRDGKMLRF